MHIHPFDIDPNSLAIANQMDSSSSPASEPLPPRSPSPSLVSRAKTALHSAAAKAERVITEIKADLKSDRESDGLRISRRSSEQELNALNRPKEEIPEREIFTVEVVADSSKKLIIPPASVIKQLAAVLESGRNFRSMNNLPSSGGEPSPIKEKTGISFSAVKSLVLREKEDKISFESCTEEFNSLICFLFDSEEQSAQMKNGADSASFPVTYIPRDIRGAPPKSFVVQLAEIVGGFKSLQKMALFWSRVVVELRRQWDEEQPIPRMPLDTNPDLNSCILHQQLQVINCCIARKHRRRVAIQSLDSFVKDSSVDNNETDGFPGNPSPNHMLYARTNSGDHVLRLGADRPSENLTMLETGETIYSPITQEGPVLTEELIKETEELILRTGSVGAGCSQLLSDMQAFKASCKSWLCFRGLHKVALSTRLVRD
ncbi:rab3 GTPase-activating protein catalytic subunit [Iris pallida]|uniref:Rab3 GTPase-activating protein catalytic subunit n=1 Tax=Iris pallida TaxID=29817 RepID=A0AAX6EXI9_IRIPA|nr:rab3 GTPase-activating protein catalytic subunit [Iris pallida]